MQRANFYVDYCINEDEGHLFGRYGFWIDFPDEIYEELFQVWFDNNSSLNSWDTNWDGHDELHDEIWRIATKNLNIIMEKENPELGSFSPYETHWELSKETADAF